MKYCAKMLALMVLVALSVVSFSEGVQAASQQDVADLKRALKTFFPYENIGVESVSGSIALTGGVTDAEIAHRAMQVAKEFAKRGGEKSSVLNLMQVKTGQQVMLRVRVGEIRRTALKKIGVSLQGVKASGNLLFPFATGSGIGAPGTVGGAFGSAGVNLNTNSFDLSATLDMLEQNGLFKVLAEPNLVAISGEKAEFLAGGQFPVPIVQQERTISVDYKTFGVEVEFTPMVLSQNRVRLMVEPEVSELSDEAAIKFAGYSVPSITSRRAKTTVELAPGESFMIAGLMKDDMRSTISQIPGLSEIPILSALFRSTAYQRNETELVIAVTPYLVDPVASNDIRLPTDDFRTPSTMEMMFYGALSSVSGSDPKQSQGPALEGPVGYMVD